MRTPFFLSHHRPEESHRCVCIAGLHLCARCLGLYPDMFAMIAAQVVKRAPLSWPYDEYVAFLLAAPAMLDWIRGRFDPWTGSNFSRVTTGALLGVSLGRTLYLHMVSPGHSLAMAQFGAIAIVVVLTELVAWRRRGRAEPSEPDEPQDNV